MVFLFKKQKRFFVLSKEVLYKSPFSSQDSFKYSYPPLVDDDFQTPLCENGPITSEDEHESKEEIDTDTKEPGDLNEEQNLNQKKVSNSES